MLEIHVNTQELYDETTGKFVIAKPLTVLMEHSLVSLSKWESKHEKPFLGREEKTTAEIMDYMTYMLVGENPPVDVVHRFTSKNYSDILEYINAKQTATWFVDKPTAPSRETITSELIYYWMISFSIPIQCETWHLNRLLTLIRVCNVKNQPQKKTSRGDLARRNRELNAQRREQYGTRG
jgi:hypothetical protein